MKLTSTTTFETKVVPTPPTKNITFKKAGTKTAHVVFVLDGSSSMIPHAAATIAGYNEFLETQKASEIPTKVSLYQFNGWEVKTIYEYVDVALIEKLTSATYRPSGNTNLYDAIGITMRKINERLEKTKKADRDSVTIAILTDGEENSSREFGLSDIKGLVKSSEEKNWSYFFLGANIDTFAVGSSLGFGVQNTISYDMHNVAGTMSVTSTALNRMKSARSLGMDTNAAYASAAFTDAERSVAKDD